MANENSPRFSLPLLVAGQAQKELFHNEALLLLDALAHPVAQSAAIAVAPANPDAGQCWIVGTGPSGAWAGKQGYLAVWSEGGWRFVQPVSGLRVHIIALGHALIFDGNQWGAANDRADGYYINGLRLITVRQPAISGPQGGTIVDAECRSALNSVLSAMRNHGLIST